DQDRQDNTLQGWPWIEESFSWVEPTAWCMLAMKISSALLPDRERAARIDEAERLLLDRMCQTGGWNYGNSNTLGRELSAHVPTTALALLALRIAAIIHPFGKVSSTLRVPGLPNRRGWRCRCPRFVCAATAGAGRGANRDARRGGRRTPSFATRTYPRRGATDPPGREQNVRTLRVV